MFRCLPVARRAFFRALKSSVLFTQTHTQTGGVVLCGVVLSGEARRGAHQMADTVEGVVGDWEGDAKLGQADEEGPHGEGVDQVQVVGVVTWEHQR